MKDPSSHLSSQHMPCNYLASSLPHTKEFRRAERLSGFWRELVLDGEALLDS